MGAIRDMELQGNFSKFGGMATAPALRTGFGYKYLPRGKRKTIDVIHNSAELTLLFAMDTMHDS